MVVAALDKIANPSICQVRISTVAGVFADRNEVCPEDCLTMSIPQLDGALRVSKARGANVKPRSDMATVPEIEMNTSKHEEQKSIYVSNL